VHVLQNLWRPVLVSRFDEHSNHMQKATVLSIESQAGSLWAAVLAPLLGYAVDCMRDLKGPSTAFWPIGAVGALIALGFIVIPPKRSPAPETQA
jgi:hypothetical protein